jgi:tRNA(Arg) A34 adenosine deaminase TadA
LKIKRKLNDANDEDEDDYYFFFVVAKEVKVAIWNKEGGPFGVIVKNGEIIAQTHNEVLTTKNLIKHA